MPAIDPSTVSGYLADLVMDPEAISGSDGSTVSSHSGWAPPSGFSGLLLHHGGPNGYKVLGMDVGRALSKAAPTWTPNPNNSGGAFPVGFSALAVVRVDDYSPMGEGFLYDRRTFCGWRSAVSEGVNSGWSVSTSGRQTCTFQHGEWTGSWGDTGPAAAGVLGVGNWYVVGVRTDGETLTLWKGFSVDRTESNPQFVNDYTQYMTGFCLGAESTRAGARDFEGRLAYFVPFSRAVTDGEYAGVAEWLMTRFDIPARDISVKVTIGRTGMDVFASFRESRTGRMAGVNSAPDTSGISYRINGGSPVTPDTVLFKTWTNDGLEVPIISIPLETPITSEDSLTLSIDAQSVETKLGFVDPLEDEPATSYVGETTILPDEIPESVTMRLGWGVNQYPGFWTPECYTRNLFHGSAPSGDVGPRDSLGYPTVGTPSTAFILRQGSADPSPKGIVYDPRGAEFGRYVVRWRGPSGSLFVLAPGAYDDDQTQVSHVEGMDDLSGEVKKRYFDITSIGVKARPDLVLVWTGDGGYCTDIVVELASYESRDDGLIFTDQLVSRMSGFDEIRSMDAISTNFSNVGRPSDFHAAGHATWGDSVRQTIAISGIEAYSGTHYLPDNGMQHWKVTFSAPHGLVGGQGFTIRSTDSNPINVVVGAGTVNLDGFGGFGWPVSETEFYVFQFRESEWNHSPTVTPFSGGNAVGDIDVAQGIPIEAFAAMCNEAGVAAAHPCIPHACTDEAVAEFAARLAASLSPSLKCFVELSNEPWNLGFGQNYFFAGESARLSLASAEAQDWIPSYTLRSIEVLEIFKSAWSDADRDPADVELVLNAMWVMPSTTSRMAEIVAATSPGTLPRYSVAPYHDAMPLGRVTGFDYSAWTVDRMVDYWHAFADAFDPGSWSHQHIYAIEEHTPGSLFGAYEHQLPYLGFSSYDAEGSGWEAWDREFLALLHDPGMRGVWIRYLAGLQESGLDFAIRYSYASGAAYEFINSGLGKYGDFGGVDQAHGRGESNAAQVRDEGGLPAWPASIAGLESVRGGVTIEWQAAAEGVRPPLAAYIAAVASPRETPVSGVGVSFNRSVVNVSIGDFSLTRDDSPLSLGGATLSGSGHSYTLGNLSSVTADPGVYVLRLVADGSGIVDLFDEPLTSDASRSWTNNGEGPPDPPDPEPSFYGGIRICNIF